MLEFSKQVLQKVSFDRHLFNKELKKSIAWIRKEERMIFKTWCIATFGHLYSDVIAEAFTGMV